MRTLLTFEASTHGARASEYKSIRAFVISSRLVGISFVTPPVEHSLLAIIVISFIPLRYSEAIPVHSSTLEC